MQITPMQITAHFTTRLKAVLRWSAYGAIFGVAFGWIASWFQGGPAAQEGIAQSWWWFATAGALKALTDPTPKRQGTSGV